MKIDLIKSYHALPHPFRALAASVRGYYLNWWRYGPETDHLVAEALERETWTEDQWKSWRDGRLSRLLHHAATQVPFYRELWSLRRQAGDRASWEYLENWPVLQKETLRANPRAFVADDLNGKKLWEEHTSGTTGKPLTIWMTKNTVRRWYALFEARWRKWYGLSRHDPWGILGGQLVIPFEQNRPPFGVWNAGMNQLYLSVYHLSPQNISSYLDAIRKYKVVYLWGYASALYTLARSTLELSLTPPVLRAVISNAEPLYQHQREVISRAFGCAVHDTYGLSELVSAASECSFERLHLWPEAGLTEILDENENRPVSDNEVGRLVATGLINDAMPLLRYETGDRASLTNSNCDCGRTMPILANIEGRMDDVVVTPDGRRIGRLDPVFKADMPIIEAQIIQETLHCLRVRYVPAAGFSQQTSKDLVRRLKDRVGDMEIVLEDVESLPRSANGKFRAVISLLEK